MCNSDRELVEDVLSLRNQLRRTERNLQALGEQLSQSENDGVDSITGHKSGSGSDGYVTFDDLHKPGALKASSYPGRVARSSTPKPAGQKTRARARSSDCRPRSDRDMENEAAQLRRKLSSVREENSSLVMENRQLISDLEAAQIEIASSKSKMRVLGSTIGARTSSVSIMKERILDLEAQLEAQATALREADLKRAAREQTALQCNRAVEKLEEELNAAKSELRDKTRQWKRTEQQRNQALRNAERLTAAFRDYKEDVAEKLKKVIENEGKLKASLIECDREREELEKRCTEVERERERTSHSLSRELMEARVHSEALSAERQELQGRVRQASEQLGRLQRELEQKETQLQEVEGLRREREDLRLLTACQEQRLTQTHRDVEQARAELASLENVLDMLHLRENRDGELCVNPCLLPSLTSTAVTENLQHKPGERYGKLLVALQSVEKEKARQASAAQSLQDRLSRAQEEISSLQTSITQRASHYQQLHNQLLDKAAQATTLEKELKKKSARLVVVEKQLQEKSAAYSQAAIKTSQLEQEIMEKDGSIHHYQSLLKKRQREYQQAAETSKMAETHRCRELEDRMEELRSCLDQSQAEVAALKQTVSDLQSEKQEVEHQAGLLQASVDQLTQEMEMKNARSEEAARAFEEQALESASRMKFMESELSCCKEELSDGLRRVEKVKQQYEKQLELKNSELSVLQEAVRSRTLACESSSEENLQLQRSMQRQHAMLQESTSRIAQLEDSQSHLQSQVSQLEQELERERTTSLHQLRRKQVEVEEAKQEVQKKEKETVDLSSSITQLSSEMNACREELSDMEKELLQLRRDSSSKATQLSQMEETLQETRGMLDKKSEMVVDLEEKLHRSEMDRRNSLQRARLLEEQLNTVRGELSDTLGHLEELRDVLQRTQLAADQRQATIHQLTAELRESQQELEERNHEVLDMDTALKERQGELQQRAELLGQLDVVIKEHKLEMERKVEHLQEVQEKTERKLREREKRVGFLTEKLELVKSQLQGKEDLEKSALELGQQLRVCREQLQKSAQDLQDTHTRCDALSRQLDGVSQQERQKETDVQQLQEKLRVVEKWRLQSEAQLQTTITELQHELQQQREEHNREVSALQQTRGQLLKVSDQISISLRSSQEQLEEARADAAELHTQLQSTQQLLQHANDTLLVKESEMARLQAKISSLERASELHSSTLHHESGTFPPLSPPLKDPVPNVPPSVNDPLGRSSISSSSWREASSDGSLELSESLKASVKAALKPPGSPCGGWQGLSHTELSSGSDVTFNPLTYMLDGEEPEEAEMDSLSGMLRFVNQTLALQERHSDTHVQAS
ncbi:coiled-coil domain-containing protein 18 isoform X1 [Ictalurus furcatus]|uniref:coiled-coil domain-containing protein 18 isoform X1 n=2 Tax=Ictalurus furcatus TaxID=66913 RepID=UPI00235018A7|nr:coiled-coil domain-containing protein 18 isoform X1 [Ictalurus furcatus]XP_053507326.1 coiled-coil domain-containing protein 18 isoform X1 [Ictalurus furcatus]